MITLYVALAVAALSGGGVHFAHKRADRLAQEKAAAAAFEAAGNVVDKTGEAVTDGIEAATAEDTTDADTRQNIAEWDATTVAVHAAVQPDASRSTVALAGYLGCVSGSQGKGEGSAAYGCNKRGESLDAALSAMPSDSCPETVPETEAETDEP